MMDVPELRRLQRVKRSDFWIAIAAILGVLSFGVLAGIVIGAILSVGWLVYVSTRPAMPSSAAMRGSHVFREHESHPEDEQFPGLVALRLDGGLFFATADALGDRIRELTLASDPPLTAVVLDCADIPFVDSEGSAKLAELVELARENGVVLRLARVKPVVLEVLTRDGVLDVDRRRPHPRRREPGGRDAPSRAAGRSARLSRVSADATAPDARAAASKVVLLTLAAAQFLMTLDSVGDERLDRDGRRGRRHDRDAGSRPRSPPTRS